MRFLPSSQQNLNDITKSDYSKSRDLQENHVAYVRDFFGPWILQDMRALIIRMIPIPSSEILLHPRDLIIPKPGSK
jgi:hypothetical protein